MAISLLHVLLISGFSFVVIMIFTAFSNWLIGGLVSHLSENETSGVCWRLEPDWLLQKVEREIRLLFIYVRVVTRYARSDEMLCKKGVSGGRQPRKTQKLKGRLRIFIQQKLSDIQQERVVILINAHLHTLHTHTQRVNSWKHKYTPPSHHW